MIGQNTNKLAQGEANKLSGDKERVKNHKMHIQMLGICAHTQKILKNTAPETIIITQKTQKGEKEEK